MAKINMDGRGYWSKYVGPTNITMIDVEPIEPGLDRLQLNVYFNKGPDEGLIYTDPLWIEEFNQLLRKHGVKTELDYTEQGMQGDDYVSLETVGSLSTQESNSIILFCARIHL